MSLGVDNSPQLIAAYQVILIVGECVDKSSECGGWSEENSCLTQLPVWRPSCSAPASEQQVVRMDTVRDLSSALWSLRTSQEAARLLRTSLSLLRCFLFFDICYLIGGITLISMALSNQVNDQENRMVFAGGLLTLFGSLSAMCNRLARVISKNKSLFSSRFYIFCFQPGQSRAPYLAQSVFAAVASIFPPRPCFSFPPPRPGETSTCDLLKSQWCCESL